MGRPALLDDTNLVQRIEDAVAVGESIPTACEYAGVHKATYHNWTKRGKAERDRLDDQERRGHEPEPIPNEAPYLDFFDRMTRARARARMSAMTTIRECFEGYDVTETITVERRKVDGGVEMVTTTKQRRERRPDLAAWYLERAYPAEYGRTFRTDAPASDAPLEPEAVDAKKERARELVRDQLAEKREQRALAAGTTPPPAAPDGATNGDHATGTDDG